jgi:hypothetical protein
MGRHVPQRRASIDACAVSLMFSSLCPAHPWVGCCCCRVPPSLVQQVRMWLQRTAASLEASSSDWLRLQRKHKPGCCRKGRLGRCVLTRRTQPTTSLINANAELQRRMGGQVVYGSWEIGLREDATFVVVSTPSVCRSFSVTRSSIVHYRLHISWSRALMVGCSLRLSALASAYRADAYWVVPNSGLVMRRACSTWASRRRPNGV